MRPECDWDDFSAIEFTPASLKLAWSRPTEVGQSTSLPGDRNNVLATLDSDAIAELLRRAEDLLPAVSGVPRTYHFFHRGSLQKGGEGLIVVSRQHMSPSLERVAINSGQYYLEPRV